MTALPSDRLRVHAQRRHDLLARLDGSTCVVIAATPVTIRNSDVEHAFRQDSDLMYLTGFVEPETVMVLAPRHKEHRFVLFVRPRDPERETWDGLRAGVEGREVVRVLHLDQLVGLRAPHDVAVRGVAPLLPA